ncbi:MAG: hypothetical protein IPQ05_15495 [Leptospiraceae bacterium]|nr:hypothetical protein [Leptospiraceae bacterium]MBL0265222.1 hypothetical protein [Leptospiraceae bacterium]
MALTIKQLLKLNPTLEDKLNNREGEYGFNDFQIGNENRKILETLRASGSNQEEEKMVRFSYIFDINTKDQDFPNFEVYFNLIGTNTIKIEIKANRKIHERYALYLEYKEQGVLEKLLDTSEIEVSEEWNEEFKEVGFNIRTIPWLNLNSENIYFIRK